MEDLSLLRIEILNACNFQLCKGFNKISTSKLRELLIRKDYLTYGNVSNNLLAKELRILFPIHKNNRKRIKYYKISSVLMSYYSYWWKINFQNAKLTKTLFYELDI